MAGIYIPDMEMPTKCPCRLVGSGYDVYCYAVNGIPARAKEYDECCENGTKASWCPLVPVPPCRECINGSKYEQKPQTNGEMIRAMSDEDLAEWLSTQAPSFIKLTVRYAWLNWLKQEAME